MSNLAKAARKEHSLEQIGPQVDLCLRKTLSCVTETLSRMHGQREVRVPVLVLGFRNIYQSSIKYYSDNKCPDRGGERRQL
jgi:hypothetical protein